MSSPKESLALSDQYLVEQTLIGKTSCFEQLVFRYQQKLMRFLKLRCNCFSDAEDIFQETFISAHRYLYSYNVRFAFSTWLFNIAINLIKRKLYQLKEIYSPEPELRLPQTEQHKLCALDNPASNIAENKSNNIWVFAKQCLNEEQISLLWFTYTEGYTGKEVAMILGRSLAWVKINLIRTRQQLKAALNASDLSFSDWVEE